MDKADKSHKLERKGPQDYDDKQSDVDDDDDVDDFDFNSLRDDTEDYDAWNSAPATTAPYSEPYHDDGTLAMNMDVSEADVNFDGYHGLGGGVDEPMTSLMSLSDTAQVTAPTIEPAQVYQNDNNMVQSMPAFLDPVPRPSLAFTSYIKDWTLPSPPILAYF